MDLELCLRNARPLIYSFARSSGLDVDDLLQETAIKLWQASAKIDGAKVPTQYAQVVARHRLIDLYHLEARRRCQMPTISLDRPLSVDCSRSLLDIVEGN